jgi:catechol-2,3-dioxygenase
MLQLKDFYCDVVGLQVGPREGFSSRGFWLYAGDKVVLHLAEYRGEEAMLTHVLTSVDHFSFTCTNMPAMEAHLSACQVNYTVRDLPVLNVKQINFKDPVGNGVELFFQVD